MPGHHLDSCINVNDDVMPGQNRPGFYSTYDIIRTVNEPPRGQPQGIKAHEAFYRFQHSKLQGIGLWQKTNRMLGRL